MIRRPPGVEQLAVVPGGDAAFGPDDIDVEPAVGHERGLSAATVGDFFDLTTRMHLSTWSERQG